MNNIDFIKQLKKIYKGVNKIMEKATVIYTGTLVTEGDKIYLKDIAVKSNFNNSLGKLFDCTTNYNTFSLENGFEIYYFENNKEVFGKLFWDKKNKQWFIYNEKEDSYNDIKSKLIVSYNWDIVISDLSELELADEKSELKEVAGILKWLN